MIGGDSRNRRSQYGKALIIRFPRRVRCGGQLTATSPEDHAGRFSAHEQHVGYRAGRFGLLPTCLLRPESSQVTASRLTNFQTRDGQVVNGALRINYRRERRLCAYWRKFRPQDTDRKANWYGWATVGKPEKTLLLTGQFLSTQATRGAWTEHTFETESGSSPYNTYPGRVSTNAASAAVCPPGFANYQYSSNNVFEKDISPSQHRLANCDSVKQTSDANRGMQMNLSRDIAMSLRDQDASLNLSGRRRPA